MRTLELLSQIGDAAPTPYNGKVKIQVRLQTSDSRITLLLCDIEDVKLFNDTVVIRAKLDLGDLSR